MATRCPRILTLCLSLSLVGFAETQSVARIEAALRQHNFTEALKLLAPAVKASPADARLWAMQGAAYAAQGDKKRALSSFRQALKIAPNAIPALHGAAQIEYENGSAAGIPLLQRLLKLEPENVTTHGMLAVLAYQTGDCKLAATQFGEAGNLFDRRPDGLRAYATCLMRLKEFERAAVVLEKALVDSGSARDRQVVAALQLRTGHNREALSTLGPLLTAQPDPQTLELAATAQEETGNTPEAIELLRRAILIEPHNVNLYVDFALIAAAHQSNDVGIGVVSDGIALEPQAAPLYLVRGVLYAQLDQYEKAEADFEKANEFDPGQSLTTAAQGLAAMQKNDMDKALASVEQRLKRTPSDPALLYLHADILSQRGAAPASPDFIAALRSARKAVSLQPTLGPAHGVLAKLYLRQEKYKEAAGECRLALKIDPSDQTALYRLIQALRKDGDNAETPHLVKRLAELRKQSTKEERERNRYRLADDSSEARP
jgi:tetratricopeptide (TPR) repeat protein